MKEYEPKLESPQYCPRCKADLTLPHSITAYKIPRNNFRSPYDSHSIGHLEMYHDGIKLILNIEDFSITPYLECLDCRKNLDGLVIKEILFEPDSDSFGDPDDEVLI